ncbi:MAG: hypothetical protein V7K70_03405 [Nostoc sp.]
MRSRKNLPLILRGASVANQIAVSAPSSGERGADEPPISVLTHPGQMELTTIPLESKACANIIVAPFNASFDRQ